MRMIDEELDDDDYSPEENEDVWTRYIDDPDTFMESSAEEELKHVLYASEYNKFINHLDKVYDILPRTGRTNVDFVQMNSDKLYPIDTLDKVYKYLKLQIKYLNRSNTSVKFILQVLEKIKKSL